MIRSNKAGSPVENLARNCLKMEIQENGYWQEVGIYYIKHQATGQKASIE